MSKAIGLLTYFGLQESDEARLARLRPIFAAVVDEIVTRFCEHLRRFPETSGIVTDPERALVLQRLQREYILSLGRFVFGDPASVSTYCAHRLQIGKEYRRIGLASRLHFGAFSKFGELLIEVATAGGAVDSIASLHKLLLFDSHVAIDAYERASHDRLVEMASVDELTRMLTRKALLSELGNELARARRFGRPLTLAFLDIDRFKQINDSRGHAFGDRVLQDVAEVLHTSIRPMDIVGRYGGDEFVVGIVEASEAAARPVAERIHRHRATLAVPDVTVSIGLAGLRGNDSLDSLLARADAAMYRAKALGPGQIALSGAG
jgi:diguanylate cyclase (GGDEF)-like protein